MSDTSDQYSPSEDGPFFGADSAPGREEAGEPSTDEEEVEPDRPSLTDRFQDCLLRFRDWLNTEDAVPAKLAFAGFLLFIMFVLIWRENGETISNTFDSVYNWIQARTSPTEQLAAIVAIAALLVYRVRRAMLIRRGLKPVPWLLILLAVAVALGFTMAATWLMFREAAKAPETTSAQLRFDAVKTAITLFAGTTGAGVLLLSFRSHFTSETDRLNSQFDSAADKLSQESQVIQTAGLLALERIALKHRAYKRAVVELLLAYGMSENASNRLLAANILRRLRSREVLPMPTHLSDQSEVYWHRK